VSACSSSFDLHAHVDMNGRRQHTARVYRLLVALCHAKGRLKVPFAAFKEHTPRAGERRQEQIKARLSSLSRQHESASSACVRSFILFICRHVLSCPRCSGGGDGIIDAFTLVD
jgi:hypothetical protein